MKILRKIPCFAAILILVAGTFTSLYAQDAKVVTGVISYDQQKYPEAIQLLEQSLRKPADLSTTNLPKAHLYLAQAYLRVGNDDGYKRDFSDPLQSAFDNLEAGKKADTEGKWKELSTLMEQLLWASLYNEGAIYYNARDYKTAKEYFLKSKQLDPKDYKSNLMLGYTLWVSKDTTGAMDAWNEARKIYQKAKPQKADENLVSAYVLLANVYANAQGNANLALSVLAEGRKEFPENEDLQMTELGIYQDNPRMVGQSKAKFENAISAKPGDKTLRLAYAALLTQNGEVDKGLEVYQEVLKLDPRDYNANLAVGSSLYNQGATLTQKIIKSENKDEILKYQEEAWTDLKKAFPHLKVLHEKDPTNPQWVNYLVNITQYVPELHGESAKWVAKQK